MHVVQQSSVRDVEAVVVKRKYRFPYSASRKFTCGQRGEESSLLGWHTMFSVPADGDMPDRRAVPEQTQTPEILPRLLGSNPVIHAIALAAAF